VLKWEVGFRIAFGLQASPQVPSLTQLLVGEKMPINIDMSGPTYCTTVVIADG